MKLEIIILLALLLAFGCAPRQPAYPPDRKLFIISNIYYECLSQGRDDANCQAAKREFEQLMKQKEKCLEYYSNRPKKHYVR